MPNFIKKNINWILPLIITILFSSFFFLWGPGILSRPNIKVIGGSVELKIPDKIQANYLFFRLMFRTMDMVKNMFKDLEDNLRDMGFPEEKLKELAPRITIAYENTERLTPITVDSISKELDLEPDEQRMLLAAIFNLRTLEKSTREGFLPTSAAFFKVVNKGRKDAEKLRVIIEIPGSYMYSTIECDDIFAEQTIDKGLELTLNKLSPRGYISGSVWYDSFGAGTDRKSKITVIYKNGRKEIEFSEGELDKIISK